MIQPTELRIGNITKQGVIKGIIDQRIFINKLAIHYNNVEPIELTEEILLKCGFIKDECVNKRCKCYSIKVKNIGGDIDVPYCIEYTFRDGEKSTNFVSLPSKEIKIDYLHKLQNFIFAYTGTELDVSKVTE